MRRTRDLFPDTRSFVRYSTRFAHGKVLDLGAGRAKYKGIITEVCPQYATADVVPGSTVDTVCDIEHTPFPDGSFNTVYCTQVLEHVRHPWLVAREVYRILSSGGTAIISVPFLQGYHADPEDYFRYTIQGIESIFADAGFNIVESGSYAGGFWSLIVDSIRKIFWSAYATPKLSSRLERPLVEIAAFLDRFGTNNVVYLNLYVVATKRP